MNDEIYKERRRIAYRLCACFTPLEAIAFATKVPLLEVEVIDRKRTAYYNKLINERTNFSIDIDLLFAKLEWEDIERLSE
ncbi:hypothetical protein M3181_22005 [Mesobacillus maritimus]|uniref:hypothetical protein n=1 Tax=Mesobacillus maritimus TaxID=1643336 RepID=UPI00203D837C|nr:hypothetical protein [Mesobacillus maritimus]MCM3671634.1 hypothetical protein [Mesobacillus maritimus]